jgi:uncharacterized metal-binding protein YceD (DUF177 family)
MKVHLLQVPPEGVHLVGKEKTEILELNEPQHVHPLDHVAYDLQVGISGTSLFATGRLWVDVELECVSCLRKFVYPLVVPDFAAQVDLTGPEVIDLTPLVREDILLVLPAHPRCDWDGTTVCPGPRAQGRTADAEPTQVPSAWDALDDLDLKPKVN